MRRKLWNGLRYFTHVQTCNVARFQSATEWTVSVHTLHMSMQCNPCSKCPRNGLLRYISSTPGSQPLFKVLRNVHCGTYFTHVQTCNSVLKATECILGFRVSLQGLKGGHLNGELQVPFRYPLAGLRGVF